MLSRLQTNKHQLKSRVLAFKYIQGQIGFLDEFLIYLSTILLSLKSCELKKKAICFLHTTTNVKWWDRWDNCYSHSCSNRQKRGDAHMFIAVLKFIQVQVCRPTFKASEQFSMAQFYPLGCQLLLFSCCHVQLSATPWTAAHQASLSFTISWHLLKLMFIESMVPSNHLILCFPLLLLPSIFPASGLLDSLNQVVKALELYFQHQPFQWIFRVDFLSDWLVWSPCCPRDTEGDLRPISSTVSKRW